MSDAIENFSMLRESVDVRIKIHLLTATKICIGTANILQIFILGLTSPHEADRILQIHPTTVWTPNRVPNHPLDVFWQFLHFLNRVCQELVLLLTNVSVIGSRE